MTKNYEHELRLIRELRGMGATTIKVGSIEAVFPDVQGPWTAPENRDTERTEEPTAAPPAEEPEARVGGDDDLSGIPAAVRSYALNVLP